MFKLNYTITPKGLYLTFREMNTIRAKKILWKYFHIYFKDKIGDMCNLCTAQSRKDAQHSSSYSIKEHTKMMSDFSGGGDGGEVK